MRGGCETKQRDEPRQRGETSITKRKKPVNKGVNQRRAHSW